MLRTNLRCIVRSKLYLHSPFTFLSSLVTIRAFWPKLIAYNLGISPAWQSSGVGWRLLHFLRRRRHTRQPDLVRVFLVDEATTDPLGVEDESSSLPFIV